MLFEEAITILEEIENEMLEADTKASDAFQRSKYAIAEYWLCIVFRMESLYRRIEKRLGTGRALGTAEFSKKIAEFRRSLK